MASAAEINDSGGTAQSVRADMAIPEEIEAMVASAITAYGSVDVLVNNAGVGFHRLFTETTLLDWERVLRINLTGPFLACQAAARSMTERGGGRIVNIASISGQRGSMGRIAYGTAKAGLIQLTKVMAVELAPANIAVNAIAPGPIQTDMTNHGPAQRKAYLDRIPMGRYGGTEAVAAAALYLASDECQFVTGHVINVDGGFNSSGLLFSQEEMKSFRSGPGD
jgi:3-oxoacyl-[acyl-carrier protein] reductase